MKEYFKIHIDSLKLLKGNLHKFIGYELITSLFIFVTLIPGFNLLLNEMMKQRGYTYITNGLIQKFLVSPQGMILVVATIIIGLLLVLVQQGGLIVLAHLIIKGNKNIRYFDVVKYTLSRAKYMIGIDGLLLTIYFLLIAPLLDLNFQDPFFEWLEVPGFVVQVIASNELYLLSTITLVVFLLFMVYRYMFAFQALLLDTKVDRHFLKRSRQVKKGNGKKILMFYFTEFIVALLILIMFIIVVIILITSVMFIPGVSEEIAVYIAFSFIILTGFSLAIVAVPFICIQLTMFYYKLSDEIVEINIKQRDTKSKLNELLSSKLAIAITLIGLVIFSFGYQLIIDDSFRQVKYDVGITAHRGSSTEAPENTLSAIELAIENGATHIEIDVQLTKDNEIILLHDKTFNRTAGVRKRPDQMTLNEIKKLDVGSWFSSYYRNEKVPTLDEVMDLVRGKVILNIEVKGSKYSPAIIDHLVELIVEKDFIDSCVITSLNYDDLQAIEAIKPQLKTGYIMFVALGNLSDLNVDFYSVESINVTESFVEKAHAIGREVHVWTINDEDDMEEMLSLGVDNIITDYESMLVNLIRK